MRAGMTRRAAALSGGVALLGIVVACRESLPAPRSEPTSTVGEPSAVPVIVTTLDRPGAATEAGGADAGSGWFAPVDAGAAVAVDPPRGLAGDAGLCGCALCAPVVSEDSCTRDADCAPATPCHATRCVAKAKAEPRKPGTMCTQIMVCGSADANGCGCVAGKCALHPR